MYQVTPEGHKGPWGGGPQSAYADNITIAKTALGDVAHWLGFRSTIAYLNTLDAEGPAILKRAPEMQRQGQEEEAHLPHHEFLGESCQCDQCMALEDEEA